MYQVILPDSNVLSSVMNFPGNNEVTYFITVKKCDVCYITFSFSYNPNTASERVVSQSELLF